MINFRGTRRRYETCRGPRAHTRASFRRPSSRMGVSLLLCTPTVGTLPPRPLAASSPGGLLGGRLAGEPQGYRRGPGPVVLLLARLRFLFPVEQENGGGGRLLAAVPRAAGGRRVAAVLPATRRLVRSVLVLPRTSRHTIALSRGRSSISCQFQAWPRVVCARMLAATTTTPWRLARSSSAAAVSGGDTSVARAPFNGVAGLGHLMSSMW